MGQDSAIAWTDHTFNPWWGCARVSPGCEHCYAEQLATVRHKLPVWGVDADRKPMSEASDFLDWVIVGGESGAGARPFALEWARDIVDACKVAGVACFVKQLGDAPVYGGGGRSHRTLHLSAAKGGNPDEWPPELRVREWPEVSP